MIGTDDSDCRIVQAGHGIKTALNLPIVYVNQLCLSRNQIGHTGTIGA